MAYPNDPPQSPTPTMQPVQAPPQPTAVTPVAAPVQYTPQPAPMMAPAPPGPDWPHLLRRNPTAPHRFRPQDSAQPAG